MENKDNQRQAALSGREMDIAYCAGFFDGEGCVSVGMHAKGNGKSYPHLHIIMTQKVIEPLEKFRQTFGLFEKINFNYRRDKLKSNPKRRPGYFRLTVSGKRASQVLELLLPYLIVKDQVAKVAIEFQNDIESFPRADRAFGLDPTVYERRKKLIEQVKWINTGRWVAAETKSSGPERVCDSPSSTQ